MKEEQVNEIIHYLNNNKNLPDSIINLLNSLADQIYIESYASYQLYIDDLLDLEKLPPETIATQEFLVFEEEKEKNDFPIESFVQWLEHEEKKDVSYPENIPPLLSNEELQQKLITFPIFEQKNSHSLALEALNDKIKSYNQEHIKKNANNFIDYDNSDEFNMPWIGLEELSKLHEDIDTLGTADKIAKVKKYLNKIKTHKSVLHFDQFEQFTQLTQNCPNFKEVSQFYKGSFVLNNSKYLCDKTYHAPTPILLLGEPGIGKTYFAKKLAQLLGTTFHFLDANSITASWVLTGSSGQWQNADAGNIFKYLLESNTMSPVVILDEIDKLSQGKSYDPFSVFHQMFEPENSSQFKDEFLNMSFDASKIIYILTANSINNIPDSLLSRMRIFDIKRPNDEEMKIITQNIYQDIIGNTPLLKKKLDNHLLDKLISLPPRDIKKQISNAVFSQLADSQDPQQSLKLDIKTIEKNWGF